MKAKKLTPKQEIFVQEFLKDLNATASAKRAGYSENCARQIGQENLTKPVISAAIADAMEKRSQATKIDAEWVLRELVSLYQKSVGDVRPVSHPKTRKQIKTEKGEPIFAFSAAAALRSLELLGRHTNVGAFRDRTELSSGPSFIEALQASIDGKIAGNTCRV